MRSVGGLESAPQSSDRLSLALLFDNYSKAGGKNVSPPARFADIFNCHAGICVPATVRKMYVNDIYGSATVIGGTITLRV
jgi:hypothetical protein